MSEPRSQFIIHRSEPLPIMVDPKIILDNRLSLGAKGLILHILNYKDSWKYDLNLILSENKETPEQVEKYLSELISTGYIQE